jgi:hypothetical protein
VRTTKSRSTLDDDVDTPEVEEASEPEAEAEEASS